MIERHLLAQNLAQARAVGTLLAMHNYRTFHFCLVVIAVLSFGSSVFAQTGSTLMLKPWAPDKTAEAEASGIWLGEGKTDNNSAGFQLSMYESYGRVKMFPGKEASPRFGYDFLMLDVDSRDPGIPHQLYDQSLSAGLFVWKYSGWVAGVQAGVGYAGDAPFGDSNAWYYRASIGAGKEIDPAHESVLAFVIDYDGNRTIFRDVPLPGFVYTYRLDPTLRLTLGLPLTGVLWTPTDKLSIDAYYTLRDRLDASITYDLTKHLAVYSRLESRQEGFWTEATGSNDRVLFQHRRVEAGVKVKPTDELSIFGAIGYAFDQEFSVGWDQTDSKHLADVSDNWYFRVGMELQF